MLPRVKKYPQQLRLFAHFLANCLNSSQLGRRFRQLRGGAGVIEITTLVVQLLLGLALGFQRSRFSMYSLVQM